jgi:chemotaxis protein methyltransferase CheR
VFQLISFSATDPIELNDKEFKKFSQLVYDRCGICLTDGKKELVKARLGKRIRAGQFKSFHDYYEYIVNDTSGKELINLLDSISTNFTFFFREPKHFEYFKDVFLPDLMNRKRNPIHKSIRIWSAGCSSGEEPYSLAITLLEAIENPLLWNILILATDLSTRMLQIAETGIYPMEKVENLPSFTLKKYFLRGTGKMENFVRVKDNLQSLVHFQRLNLMEPFPFKNPFDCIFCRNVMIYFDRKHQTELINRFYEYLNPGGLLIVGHSESLTGIPHSFEYIQPSIYRKQCHGKR